ncbi:MAG: amidase [Candidatus Tectomicrobia bacterium]|nr:amidase [Candidatus Tectomicrobia bacterium]
MTDYADLTIAEAADRIRNKEISPVEYTQALIGHIDAHDAKFNAFLRQTPDIALQEAKQAEADIQSGAWRGPLHGVPYGLKDIIDVDGIPTTAHSAILADNLARTDAFVTTRLKAAGAVLLGKMATHEFAIGGPSFDLPWPPARNAWNRDYFPGGSSSGSGVAVAAGFMPAALGTDTGGSVRNPASMCGIVGMKATYGRVSRRGVLPLSYSLDHVGPMTRTVTDNAILLNLIAGHDPEDPGSARVAAPDFTADLDKGVNGLKIGVIRRFYRQDFEADPEITQGIEDALRILADQGAEIHEIDPGPIADYASMNRVILLSEAYAIHEQWLRERPGDYGDLARERIMPGAFLRAVDYVNAMRQRAILRRKFNDCLEPVDVAITASSMDPACPIEDAEHCERNYGRQARAPFNLTGSPALAMPTGFASTGLPLSMQIIGKPFDELTVYRVARAYERATDWTSQRPDLG